MKLFRVGALGLLLAGCATFGATAALYFVGGVGCGVGASCTSAGIAKLQAVATTSGAPAIVAPVDPYTTGIMP